MFHASFMDRKLQGHFKKVSGVFHECFEEVFREFQRTSHGVSWKFNDCFKSVMEISKVFQRSSERF